MYTQAEDDNVGGETSEWNLFLKSACCNMFWAVYFHGPMGWDSEGAIAPGQQHFL